MLDKEDALAVAETNGTIARFKNGEAIPVIGWTRGWDALIPASGGYLVKPGDYMDFHCLEYRSPVSSELDEFHAAPIGGTGRLVRG